MNQKKEREKLGSGSLNKRYNGSKETNWGLLQLNGEAVEFDRFYFCNQRLF